MQKVKSILKSELFSAVFINLIFIVIYLTFFYIQLEENDDNAMAFFAEGAYGVRTPALVFQNVIWGKFLCILYTIMPNIKWYLVCQYTMIFIAFTSLCYVMMKLQKKSRGIISSVILLTFVGYETYVIFQWTRTAAITTVGGMILLFYALELSRQIKKERYIVIVCGIVLSVFGSMIRFEIFAICVVILSVIGIYKIIKIFIDKQEQWMSNIMSYFFLFGVTGILCLTLYTVDRSYYSRNPVLANYLEYNDLRAELWDHGFPNYSLNKETYEKLGISYNDFSWYQYWNMDAELLSKDTLRTLVEIKEERKIDKEFFISFFKTYPKNFFSISLFEIFVIIGLIAIALNPKKIYIIAYEFCAVMLFELYFYYIGRYGLARIDISMWLTAITVLLYMISEDIRKLQVDNVRLILVGCGVTLSLNLSVFSTNISYKKPSIDGTKNFHQLISNDKENLYILPIKQQTYKLLENAYDLWEPAKFGDASNIYYMGGWEFNVPVKNELLSKHEVTNIYRDCINNPNMFVIVNTGADKLQMYLRENYSKNVNMTLIKNVDNIHIWRVYDVPVIPQNETKSGDLDDIKSDIQVQMEEGCVTISGYAYKENSNSFQQYAFLKLQDKDSNEETYHELTLTNLEGKDIDLMNGKYSSLSGSFPVDLEKKYNMSVLLCVDEKLYEIPVEEHTVLKDESK